MGCTTGADGMNGGFISGESSKKLYLGADVGLEVPYGKTVSSKVTWREMIILLVFNSRQRYPR